MTSIPPLPAAGEQTFVQNPFGTVTSKRVILFRAKGWPWTRPQANAFVDALRGQLFRS